MKNMTKTLGKNDIKSTIKAAQTSAGSNILHLLAIRDEHGYQAALEVMEHLMFTAPDTADNPFNNLMLLLGNAIEAYEKEHFPVENASGVEVLRFLMEENDLKQADLLHIFGSRGIASEVITGRRELSKRHILGLAEHFHVSPIAFLAP